jgi:hypothetical protein
MHSLVVRPLVASVCLVPMLTVAACGSAAPAHRDLSTVPSPPGKVLMDRSGTGSSNLGIVTTTSKGRLGFDITCAGPGSTSLTAKPFEARLGANCVPDKRSANGSGYSVGSDVYDNQPPGSGDIRITAAKTTQWRVWVYIPQKPYP